MIVYYGQVGGFLYTGAVNAYCKLDGIDYGGVVLTYFSTRNSRYPNYRTRISNTAAVGCGAYRARYSYLALTCVSKRETEAKLTE